MVQYRFKEFSLPKMILFDYGQTLVNERKFDGIKGTAEVMKYAVKNKHNYTAEDVQAAADAINDEISTAAMFIRAAVMITVLKVHLILTQQWKRLRIIRICL